MMPFLQLKIFFLKIFPPQAPRTRTTTTIDIGEPLNIKLPNQKCFFSMANY